MTRAFTAVDVPDAIRDTLSGIDMHSLARMIKAAQIHITLNFLGYIDSSMLEGAIGIVNSYRHSAFGISAGGIGMFESIGRGVVFVAVRDGAEELSEMNSQLGNLFSERGMPIDDRKFIPHITFARFKGLSRADAKALHKIVESLEERSLGRFMCTGIDLKKSVLSSTGPVYSTLAHSNFIC